MFKNYIKTAIRNLVKEKNYMLINIVSLAIGIRAAMVNPVESLRNELQDVKGKTTGYRAIFSRLTFAVCL